MLLLRVSITVKSASVTRKKYKREYYPPWLDYFWLDDVNPLVYQVPNYAQTPRGMDQRGEPRSLPGSDGAKPCGRAYGKARRAYEEK